MNEQMGTMAAPTEASRKSHHETIVDSVDQLDRVINQLENLRCAITGEPMSTIPEAQAGSAVREVHALACVLANASTNIDEKRYRMENLIEDISSRLF